MAEALEFPSHEQGVDCVMVSSLMKQGGLPIQVLSDILHIERGRIYRVLDGTEPLPLDTASRLTTVYAALHDQPPGSLRFFARFWQRELPGGSLRSHLMAPEVDLAAITTALATLRPTVDRAMREDAARKANPPDPAAISPAAHLTMHLEACVRR